MELLTRHKVTLLCVQMLASLITTATSQNIKYKIRLACDIKNDYTMDQQTPVRSLTECITTCTLISDCISVAWNWNTFTCKLSEYDTIFEVASTTSVYKQDDNWKCASLVRYPVFNALNSTFDSQRYVMTFQRAQERCLELSTSIADPSSLLAAHTLGMEYCNCAWMSNGINALVLQEYKPSCWNSYNAGPIGCSFGLADAWCLMP